MASVWTTGTERWYDDVPGVRYVGEGTPCEVQFTRYSDRSTDVFLYEDSLFPGTYSDFALTPESIGLNAAFDNDPEDPIEVGEKLVRVFVLPRLATRTAGGLVIANHFLGYANSIPASAAFPSVFLSSSPIAFGNYYSTFTHEMSHMLAPIPTWDNNSTQFTNILTFIGTLKWEWDAATGQMENRQATDASVRVIINASGLSQCDAAWTQSHVRMITDVLVP